MELQPGQKVTLCSFFEAENELHRDPPDIIGDMEDFFDREVIVREVLDEDTFKIEEDRGEWTYHVDWITSKHRNTLPPKLRKMM